MTKYPEIWAALARPFAPEDVKFLKKGPGFHYITARTAMNRLDEVLGPENWWDEYIPCQDSVICKLSIGLPDGRVLTKADAGGYAGMADAGDDDKSGFSDAFKRAAVKFGVARYLYKDGVPTFRGEGATAAAAGPAAELFDSPEPEALGAADEAQVESFSEYLDQAASLDDLVGHAGEIWAKMAPETFGETTSPQRLAQHLTSWAAARAQAGGLDFKWELMYQPPDRKGLRKKDPKKVWKALAWLYQHHRDRLVEEAAKYLDKKARDARGAAA